jgi:20S proteasome alpha/beta subunit
MTCIAWDGKTLAADKRTCYGTMISTVTKIRRVRGLLCGGSGELAFIGAMMDWVAGERDPAKFPAHQRDKDDTVPFLVIERDATISLYERTPHPIRYEQAHIAIGSGREFARAAMLLGQDAYGAVEVACRLDPGCGNGIDTLTLEG